MESSGPPLRPEWMLRTAGGNASSNGRPGTSLQSDEHSRGSVSSRSRQSGHGRDSDRERSSNSSSKSSSSGGNGLRKHDKDGSGKSRGYGSFGRSNRVREKDPLDFRGRDPRSSALVDDVFRDSLDPFYAEDRLRRAQSMLTQPPDVKGNMPGLSNGFRRSVTGFTFEKDFPVLGGEERDGKLEVERVPSPGITSPTKSVSPVTIPNGVSNQARLQNGSNGGLVSMPVPQAVATSHGLEVSNSSANLNMAKTVAQAPSRAHVSQLSVDIQLIEERNRKQCQNLIPLTPSATKISVSNSLDKLRLKGINTSASLKTTHQLHQSAASGVRTLVRSDLAKPIQQGGLQDLKQNGGFQDLKLNGISPTAKDVSNISKPVNTSTQASAAASLHYRSSVNLKSKVDSKGLLLFSPQGSFGERKSREDFFNTIRNQPSNGSTETSEPVCLSSAPGLADLEHSPRVVAHETSDNSPDFNVKPLENGNCTQGGFGCCEHKDQDSLVNKDEADVCSEHDVDSSDLYSPPIDDPEEEKFLLSLGWNGDEKVDALTPEEIESFKSQHPDIVSKKSDRKD